ncbi:hypothetical protein ENSA5_46280 [Enhygromyxa salina]|uniref:Uncharacterized protein n=1 Tax=Enhygromyxa salina TaxID=215803 RepID=A0A2S9XJP6_9BACT|nr:hypothetical protein [Enhygromyxa salina]PRP92960.1 hypothetical protein ENSA5_46280 [Enhygromyxa salina]
MRAVEDPYRPTQEALVVPARKLAGPNHFRATLHLGSALAVLSVCGWALTTALGGEFAWAIGLLMGPALLDLVRTAHELSLRHRVLVDSRGVELEWAEPAPWRPWMRQRSEAIAWNKLHSVRSSTFDNTTRLTLHRADGPSVEIGHGVYDVDAHMLQRLLLDERDERIEAPRRLAADVAGFCRERFATPVTLELRPAVGPRVIGSILAAVTLAGAAIIGFTIGGLAHAVVTAPGVLLAGFLTHSVWTESNPRVIQLGREGLAHGPSHERLELLPWTEIRFARPAIVNREVVSVRIATHSGRDIVLTGDYGVPLDELAAMISPSVDVVLAIRGARARARAQLDRGA